MIRNIPDFVNGQRSLSATTLNLIKDYISRSSNLTASGGLNLYRAATGLHQVTQQQATTGRNFFWAKVTSFPTGGAYPITEQQESAGGVFSDLGGGIVGFAYEQSGNPAALINGIYEIWTADSGDYIFAYDGPAYVQCESGPQAVNETQSLSIPALFPTAYFVGGVQQPPPQGQMFTPNTGFFGFSFNGAASVPVVSATATAAQVQAAIQSCPSIGPGGVTCTGGPLPTAITITFSGALAGGPQNLITTTGLLSYANQNVTATFDGQNTAPIIEVTRGIPTGQPQQLYLGSVLNVGMPPPLEPVTSCWLFNQQGLPLTFGDFYQCIYGGQYSAPFGSNILTLPLFYPSGGWLSSVQTQCTSQGNIITSTYY